MNTSGTAVALSNVPSLAASSGQVAHLQVSLTLVGTEASANGVSPSPTIQGLGPITLTYTFTEQQRAADHHQPVGRGGGAVRWDGYRGVVGGRTAVAVAAAVFLAALFVVRPGASGSCLVKGAASGTEQLTAAGWGASSSPTSFTWNLIGGSQTATVANNGTVALTAITYTVTISAGHRAHDLHPGGVHGGVVRRPVQRRRRHRHRRHLRHQLDDPRRPRRWCPPVGGNVYLKATASGITITSITMTLSLAVTGSSTPATQPGARRRHHEPVGRPGGRLGPAWHRRRWPGGRSRYRRGRPAADPDPEGADPLSSTEMPSLEIPDAVLDAVPEFAGQARRRW